MNAGGRGVRREQGNSGIVHAGFDAKTGLGQGALQRGRKPDVRGLLPGGGRVLHARGRAGVASTTNSGRVEALYEQWW
jgi:hypothetical protein